MILRGRKRKAEKEMETWKAVKETALEFFNIMKYTVRKELGKIAVLLQILAPVFIVLISDDVPCMIVLSVLFTVIVKYISAVSKKLNNQAGNGVPIPVRKFVKEDKCGFVGIDERDMQEAILYLSDLEDYFISKGMLKKNEQLE